MMKLPRAPFMRNFRSLHFYFENGSRLAKKRVYKVEQHDLFVTKIHFVDINAENRMDETHISFFRYFLYFQVTKQN